MEPTTPQRTGDRTRAIQRLRSLTIGTALAGVAATAGLGWIAATSDPGSSATVASVAGSGTSTTTTASTTSGTSSSSSATATPSPTTSNSTSGVSSSSGSGQVSTGGS